MVKKTNFFNIAPFPSNSSPIASSRDVSHTKVKSDFSLEQYFFYKLIIKARRCTINTAVCTRTYMNTCMMYILVHTYIFILNLVLLHASGGMGAR